MPHDNLTIIKKYLDAIQRRAPYEEIATFYHPDVVQEEFPNRLVPNGARRDLAALMERAARGRQVLRGERYEIDNAIVDGDRVALELLWVGTLAIAIGSLAAGDEMRAHFGMFLELRDGKIIAQHNYDCFDPW